MEEATMVEVAVEEIMEEITTVEATVAKAIMVEATVAKAVAETTMEEAITTTRHHLCSLHINRFQYKTVSSQTAQELADLI